MSDHETLNYTPSRAAPSVASEPLSAFCPHFHNAVELIGRRWTGAILRAMLAGRCRFSDISEAIPGLSDRLLSERLKELEAANVVTRTVYPETPVRITYSLTPKGLDLNNVMDAIARWAYAWPDEGTGTGYPRAGGEQGTVGS
jgi:DNA-binding HxlR family transcriptional regulator